MSKIKVILTKPIRKSGIIGDVISIAPGFFRYLLSKKAVLKHNKENIQLFEQDIERLKQENHDLIVQAKKYAESIDNDGFIIVRTVSESGRLYGKVTLSEVEKAINHKYVKRNMLSIPEINTPGVYKVNITWHAEVVSSTNISIAANESDAHNNLKEYLKNDS